MKKRYGSPNAGCGQLRKKGKKTPEHFDDECDIFHARSGANGENPYRINSEARFVCSKTIACIGPNSSTCLRLELLTVHRVCSRIPSQEPDDGSNLILAIINMLAIGIETSGYIGSLALLRDGELIDERSLGEPGRRHAQALVLELRDMLQRHGAGPREVDAIAVSQGPGSFTGLRVGLVCAKTFAYATGCQFVAINTFDAIAENCGSEIGSVWVVENAQRGELFVWHLVRDDISIWRRTDRLQIVDSREWLSRRTVTETITGPGLTHCHLENVRAVLLTDDAITRPKASVIGRLGLRRLLGKEPLHASVEFDFWKSVPFYVRVSTAEEQRDIRDQRKSIDAQG